MPIYQVTIEEEHEDTFEEIYHAWRKMFFTKIIEIEAEDEEEAEDLVCQGEGTVISEEWDYGDTIGSDFHDTGESIDVEYQGERVTEVQTLAEVSEAARIARENYERALAAARESHSAWLRRQVYERGPTIENDTPSWKV